MSFYYVKDRKFCSNSNTVPSLSESGEAWDNDRHFECQECGRSVRLTKTGLVPTHLWREGRK